MPRPAARMPWAALGPKHAKVQRLRALLRDPDASAPRSRSSRSRGRARCSTRSSAGVELEAVYLPVDGAVPDGLPARLRGRAARAGARRAGRHDPHPAADPRASRRGRPSSTRRARRATGACSSSPASSDPGNVGTLLRAAEASGAVGVVVGPGTADVFSPKVVRASAGSIFGVPIAVVDDLPAALAVLGRARVGAATARSRPGGTPYTDGRGLAGRSRSCSATRRTASPTTCGRPIDELAHDPDGRGRGEPQRRDGRQRAALRGEAATRR